METNSLTKKPTPHEKTAPQIPPLQTLAIV